jgi:TRAP-type C4-dicarboxylate transport system substrate-binding protein
VLTLALVGSTLVAPAVGQQSALRIRIGTVVPRDSLWDQSLQRVRQEWQRLSGGSLRITIYPGGVLGDEIEMVRQVRQGRLQAVGLSSVGLSRIDAGVSCLQVPMMLRSYDELDYVRDRIAPVLERRIQEQGFVVLNWADGGWVHTFSKTAARTIDEVRALKLFTAAGDPDTERLDKELGFRVVPLSLADLTTGLQTGLVEAVSIVPLFAQLDGLYAVAPHMLDIRWTPLIGGTVIDRETWERIPAPDRPALLEAARAAGGRLRPEIRRLGEDAVPEMERRGLTVVRPDAAAEAAWLAAAEQAYPQLRGRYCPADVFDEVLRLRDEFRAASKPVEP